MDAHGSKASIDMYSSGAWATIQAAGRTASGFAVSPSCQRPQASKRGRAARRTRSATEGSARTT